MIAVARPNAADRIASRFPLHLVAFGVLFYGTGPVLAGSTQTTGILLSFWRLWFGCGVLGVGLLVHRVGGRPLGSRRGVTWAVAAGLAFSLNQVLFFTAIKRTSVVDASLMNTLSPIVVAILAIPLFGERPAPTFRIWSGVAMAGAALVVLGNSAGPSGDAVGMLMAIGSTSCFAVFFLISKASRSDIAVVTFLTVAMGTAAVAVSALVLVLGLDPGGVTDADLWRALAMAIIPGTLGHVAMTWPLHYVPANVPPLMRLAGPFVSGGLAWLLIGQDITWVHVVGGVVITIGLAAAIRSKAGQDLVAVYRVDEPADPSGSAPRSPGR